MLLFEFNNYVCSGHSIVVITSLNYFIIIFIMAKFVVTFIYIRENFTIACHSANCIINRIVPPMEIYIIGEQ